MSDFLPIRLIGRLLNFPLPINQKLGTTQFRRQMAKNQQKQNFQQVQLTAVKS